MARIIQILDGDADGIKVRLDDGAVVVLPHDGHEISIGSEIAPSIEFLNSAAQAFANILSEVASPHDRRTPTKS